MTNLKGRVFSSKHVHGIQIKIKIDQIKIIERKNPETLDLVKLWIVNCY